MSAGRVPARDAGLAVERTSLSWNRTSLGLLVNGVLAVLHHEGALPLSIGVVVLAVALVIAAAGSTHAAVRGRRARWSTPPTGPNTMAVRALGSSLIVLCGGTTTALVVAALS